MAKSTSGFFRRHRNSILFNKNLIISGAASFLVSAYISQLYSQFDTSDLAISAVALATEYTVYLPLFALLFYIDNRHRYIDPVTGRKNRSQIRRDIWKLFAAFSVSEVIFAVARISSQYYLLQSGLEPYEASMGSSALAWAIFFAAINWMAKLVRLFKS